MIYEVKCNGVRGDKVIRNVTWYLSASDNSQANEKAEQYKEANRSYWQSGCDDLVFVQVKALSQAEILNLLSAVD